MRLYLKHDINIMAKKAIKDQLEKCHLNFDLIGIGEVELKEPYTPEQFAELGNLLRGYGIEIVENQKSALVQKIKDIITQMVHEEDRLPTSKISLYLAESLNHSYGYLANLFSEVTHTSVENFIILQKIERAKQLMITNEFTLTEISYKLHYSSVAHLSTQFKKTTGLTPSAFLRIIKKRRGTAALVEYQ